MINYNLESLICEHTFRREISQSCRAVPLYLNTRGIGQRNKHLTDSHFQELWLQIICDMIRKLPSSRACTYHSTPRLQRKLSFHFALPMEQSRPETLSFPQLQLPQSLPCSSRYLQLNSVKWRLHDTELLRFRQKTRAQLEVGGNPTR